MMTFIDLEINTMPVHYKGTEPAQCSKGVSYCAT